MASIPEPFLAHAGAGASWQALLFVFTLGLTLFAVAARFGRLEVRSFDDLVLPLAGLAIASSIAPVFDETLSDLVGWFIPTAVAALVVLGAYALSSLSDAARRDGASVLLGIGAIASIVFGSAIGRSMHPQAEPAIVVDDVELTIVSVDGSTPDRDAATPVDSPVEIVLEITGGSVGAPEDAGERISDDAEELGFVVLFAGGLLLSDVPQETCTRDVPCRRLTYQLELPPGEQQITAEFRPSGGRLFASAIFDRVPLDVTP